MSLELFGLSMHEIRLHATDLWPLTFTQPRLYKARIEANSNCFGDNRYISKHELRLRI